MTMPPLPMPWDYCYEWDGPFGTRKFSSARWNDRAPTRSVALFTALEMEKYGAACAADYKADAERYRWIRDPNNMRARELVQYYGDVEPTELDVAIDMAMLSATPKAPSTP